MMIEDNNNTHQHVTTQGFCLSPCLSIFYLGLSVSVSFPVSVFSSSTDSTDGKAART